MARRDIPRLSDGGRHGVLTGDTDAGGVIEQDDLGDETSLLALSAADMATRGQRMRWELHRAGA